MVLLVVVAALFIWRAASRISECKKNNVFVIEGDAVNAVSVAPKEEQKSTSSFQYKYYGLFLAD